MIRARTCTFRVDSVELMLIALRISSAISAHFLSPRAVMPFRNESSSACADAGAGSNNSDARTRTPPAMRRDRTLMDYSLVPAVAPATIELDLPASGPLTVAAALRARSAPLPFPVSAPWERRGIARSTPPQSVHGNERAALPSNHSLAPAP